MAIMQNMIATVNPDVSLVAGDITYGADHGQSKVDQHFNDVMVWSQTIPYMPAWAITSGTSPPTTCAIYLAVSASQNSYSSPIESSYTTACLQNLGKDWYWFDYGSGALHCIPRTVWQLRQLLEQFYGLDGLVQPKCSPSCKTLRNNANIQFIVTWGHRPAYSSGHHLGDPTLKGYVDYLGDHFSKYVLNINGHSHNYERTYSAARRHPHPRRQPAAPISSKTAPASGSPAHSPHGPQCATCARASSGSSSVRPASSANSSAGPAGGGVNDVTCNQGDVIDSFTIGTVSSPTTSLSADPTKHH